jgi:chemotaxis family two-component system sensor kinase Cph1
MPGVFYLYNENRRLIKWNENLEISTGYSADELSQMDVLDWFDDEHKTRVSKAYEQSLAEGQVIVEAPLVTKDGRRVPYLFTGMLFQWGGERLLMGMGIDITYRKQAEKKLEEVVKILQFKNKELQDIVYSATHDLRSPLVNIEGFSGVLKSNCDNLLRLLAEHDRGENRAKQIEPLVKDEILQSLDFISSGAKKMASLLDGLLQISRVGTVEISRESIDMNKTLGEVLAVMEYQIKESNISVTVETLTDCIGDRNMVNNVFSNLIGNAIKYLDPAKESEIRISGEVEDGMSIYCVEDNGIGIASNYQKKVFEIFHRLNPSEDVEGEGLGLTIVTRIMDRLDGKIWVESEPGKGSKFFIALPGS